MSPVRIRDADPGRDAAACAAIYAPSVEEGVTSFEERAPDAAAMAARIERTAATHPGWLPRAGER
jgi:L-amino acid N-acyltransferase YncA